MHLGHSLPILRNRGGGHAPLPGQIHIFRLIAAREVEPHEGGEIEMAVVEILHEFRITDEHIPIGVGFEMFQLLWHREANRLERIDTFLASSGIEIFDDAQKMENVSGRADPSFRISSRAPIKNRGPSHGQVRRIQLLRSHVEATFEELGPIFSRVRGDEEDFGSRRRGARGGRRDNFE